MRVGWPIMLKNHAPGCITQLVFAGTQLSVDAAPWKIASLTMSPNGPCGTTPPVRASTSPLATDIDLFLVRECVNPDSYSPVALIVV